MPSLLRKLSRRRRRSSLKEKSKAEIVTKNQPEPKHNVPPSIEIERNDVSPLKNPSLNKSPSLALTENTTSTMTMPSSDSWSDETNNNNDQPDYAALIKARDPTKVIPPRPAQSRWQEEDFFKVIWVWDLSQEEIDKMRELEAKLYDVTHWKNNPYEVVRFMKGPQGYKPAERLFRRMVDWRIKENVDTILQDYTPPPVLLDYCPSAILHGLDHDGDPIYLERAGATDAAGLLKLFGHKFLIRHLIWLRELCGRGEWIKDHEERMGRPITQVTIVYDLAGLNARHMRPGVLPFFGHMMKLTQDYYTGPVKRMVIIRCPAIFRYIWAIAKNFFDPWAVAKMTFTGPHDHEEILSQFMDLSVLPPCISPEHGRGYAAEGMPQRFEGGIPPADYKEQQSKKVNTKIFAGAPSPISTAMTEESSFDGPVSVSASSLGSGFFQSGELCLSPRA